MATNWSSNIMWVEVGENNVKRLLNRANTLKNPNIQLVTFFPATLWQKRKELNEALKEERKSNPELRYKISVGKNDLILETKQRGEYIWMITPIGEFLKRTKRTHFEENVYQNSPIFKKGNHKRNITPEKEDSTHKKAKNQM